MIPEQAANRWLKRALVCVAGLMLLAGGPALAADDSEQQLTDALRSMGKGDWQCAKRTIDRLGNRQLSLYARWRELLESADKPSFRTYAAFLREHPDWPSLGTIQARAEEQIDEAVSHEERLAFFARLKPSTRQGRVRYAQALLGTGKRNEAIAGRGALLPEPLRRLSPPGGPRGPARPPALGPGDRRGPAHAAVHPRRA
jgi:hypothetical protein